MTNQHPSSSDKMLEHRVNNYMRVTRTVRWALIAAVALSFPFLAHQNIRPVIVLLVLAIIYNAALHIPAVLRQRWVTAKPTVLAFDCLFIYLLIFFSDTGFGSPYISLFIFPIISSAFWYGILPSIITAAAQSVVTISLLWPQTDSTVRPAAIREFIFRMFMFSMIGVYIGYLTRSDRRERLDLAEKDMQINQERQQLLALINNMNDAVLVVDQLGNIGLFNDSTARLVGSQYALVGKHLTDIFPLKDKDGKPANVLEQPGTTSFRRRDLKMYMSDGTTLKIEADISPYIVNQKSHGFIVILRDITKEKTLEDQQEEFISVASHEMRTPLAIAEGNVSNALASRDMPPDLAVREMLVQAHNNIMFLSNIIDDLTTLAKAERDVLEVDLDPLNPAQFLQELADEYRHQAEEKGLELELDIHGDIRPILTSRYRIKQIVQNFLTNALKYTKEGKITLAVENARHESEGVIFSVKDTGIGIAVSDQKKLFTKFFRSEDYRTRESGGTGLGLYITKKLAERLNGQIWYESEYKKGSTFYLQVPPYSQLKKDHNKVVKAETENFFGAI